jgi:hypothetical protein
MRPGRKSSWLTPVADEPTRQRLIDALTSFVEQNKFSGICLDFEEPLAETQPNLLRVCSGASRTQFKARGWVLTQAVPFGQRRLEIQGLCGGD